MVPGSPGKKTKSQIPLLFLHLKPILKPCVNLKKYRLAN